MTRDYRRESILFFALFSGWLLAVPFHGKVFHAGMEESGFVAPAYWVNIIIVGHFVGLIAAGFLIRSIHSARKIIIISLSACLAATGTLLLPYPLLWNPVIAMAAFFAGLSIGGWGYYFQQFTPPGRRMQTAATIIILCNIIMIFLDAIAVNLSARAGIVLSMAVLAASIYLCVAFRLPEKHRPGYTFQPQVTDMSLNRPLLLLCVFVAFITVNSGMMYQVVVPEFDHHELLSSIYWAVPYIGALYFMVRIPERFNKSYLMYIAVTMIGIAYILYFILDRSVASYIIIDTLLLGAFGVCDLFWWTILGEMLTFTKAPSRIFGIGLSANVIGILIGMAIGNVLHAFDDVGINSLIIALAIVFITLIILPILYNKLSMVIKNQEFLVGLSRQWSERVDEAPSNRGAAPAIATIPGAADENRTTIEFLQRCELTGREVEIALLLLSGETYKMIAQGLCISENTVKTHIKNIYSKLHVGSKTEFMKMVKGR